VSGADDLTTYTSRMSRYSEGLKLLEPPGPAQACNGVAIKCYPTLCSTTE